MNKLLKNFFESIKFEKLEEICSKIFILGIKIFEQNSLCEQVFKNLYIQLLLKINNSISNFDNLIKIIYFDNFVNFI